MHKRKIYFYAPAVPHHDFISANTAPLYLNAWLKNHRSDLLDKIQWNKIQFKKIDTQDHLIEQLNSYGIDILCVSVYIWNRESSLSLIKNIKAKISKELTIILGGPSSNPHTDSSLMEQNPDIDFAVYGQGEHAFSEILDYLFNQKKLSVLKSNNLSWRDPGGKIKVGTFQWLNNKNSSPYLESSDLLEQIAKDPDYQNLKFLFPYESSRGCAFNCSFCDWTGGLSHKVYHRSFEIEKEIDLLGRMGFFHIFLADANFGEHRQDFEIIQTMARLKKEKNYNFKIVSTNFSKLNKKNNFKIIDLLLDAQMVRKVKISVQDTNQSVLENIDRPDVPWIDHRKMIRESQQRHPTANFRIELIQGLPGQTPLTWEQTLIDVSGFSLIIYPWVILPNSPAGYDKEYSKKFQINTKFLWLASEPAKVETVISTSSYSYDDYIYFTLLSGLCSGQVSHLPLNGVDRKKLFDMVKKSVFLSETLNTIKQILEDDKITFTEYNMQLQQTILRFAQNVKQSS
jgi:radical SAM superfamily enzyme YgiQ (UPF0313 family)